MVFKLIQGIGQLGVTEAIMLRSDWSFSSTVVSPAKQDGLPDLVIQW
jgi:hypothetical protein